MSTTFRLAAPLMALLGCQAPATPPGDAEHAGTTTGEPDPSTGDAPRADMGAPESLDVPPPQEMPCQKIDFLFVIDDSGSMTDEQERLIDGFPGFIEEIEGAIAQYDFHMMVVTPSPQIGEMEPGDCETSVGSGRVAAGDGTECGAFEDDQRYADADEEAIASVFSCVAQVGNEGSGFEKPIWSMAQALTAQTGPGGCNEGFLREDAVLVVTLITDEEDSEPEDSPGGPALWKDVMVSAKHGDESAIVMLGLLGDVDLEDGLCEPFDGEGGGAEAAPRLRKFVESFEHGSWASVCSDDYAPFFNDAVADIGEACIDFTPPG